MIAMLKYFTIYFVALLMLAVTTGCTSMQGAVERTVGVGPEDNAILCVIVDVPGRFTGTTVKAKRLEFPAGFDMSTMTAEAVSDLEDRLCR